LTGVKGLPYIYLRQANGGRPTWEQTMREDQISEIETEYSLPSLTGSEKQIAWARKIRATLLVSVLDHIANARRATEDRKALRRDRTIRGAQAATEATFWLDNRDEYTAGAEAILDDYARREAEKMRTDGKPVIPTNRPIWLPCSTKPNMNEAGMLPESEAHTLKYSYPSVWTAAVNIARSEFGCGYLINVETREIVIVGPTRE
jgi:hypothetical protein